MNPFVYHSRPVFTHVKAHVGHPWNEYADSLAKATASADYSTPLPGSIINHLTSNPYVGWLNQAHALVDDPAYPPVQNGQFIVTPVITHAGVWKPPDQQVVSPPKLSYAKDPWIICIRGASHNVLSALDSNLPDCMAHSSLMASA